MKSMRNTVTKTAYLNFEDFFFVVDVVIYNYIMQVSVYENCRIQSTSVWSKNHKDILNATIVMTGYIQEPWLKILVKFQVVPLYAAVLMPQDPQETDE